MSHSFGIAIHGGAGVILREKLSPKMEKDYRTKLMESITAGISVLEEGGTSINAVQQAILVMEDSDLFNAGKGSVFTHDGTNEMDASIMCGNTHQCGAVAGVSHVKNPILLADKVRTHSEHIILGHDGAEAFAKKHHIDLVDKEYFYTRRRWFQLQMVLEKEKETQKEESILDHDGDDGDKGKHGTVGAVALDKEGNLAAATSSGGMTNKKYNRIGDSPIIGAGTYADNKSCAVSTTGHGEFFMRLLTAYDVSALMLYKNVNIIDAAQSAINKLSDLNGTGGLIAIDKDGHISMPMNTPGMYRASFFADDSEPILKIFSDE